MKTAFIGWATGLSRLVATAVRGVLFLVIAGGVLVRVVGLFLYEPDSGDEWGNTIAPFRVLFDGGNPNAFFHPSLYYYATAAAYAAIFAFVKAGEVVSASLSMTDLFVLDQRYFVLTARGVSVIAATLTFWAVYALAKSLWRRQAGLMAAALLAVLPAHVLYSKTVRVDSLFLLLFVVAFTAIVRMLRHGDWKTYAKAGALTGLATAANYNGAILAVWLVAAHFLRANEVSAPQPDDAAGRWSGMRKLLVALLLVGVAFFVASPFVFLNYETFLRNIAFISGMSVAEHPGWEGRDVLFYVRELVETNPYLAGLIGVSALIVVLFGDKRERFVLSLPVGYLLVFSLIASKDTRFILPAMPLLLVIASGLPFCLARRFHLRSAGRLVVYALSAVLYVPCLVTMAKQALPIHPHELLSRPDAPLFDWIETNVPRRSSIAIESGLVYLLDTLKEDGPFAAALRESIVATRPKLDHDYIGLVYIGGRNYDPGKLANGEIDYVIVSKRTWPYIEKRCGEFPDVCEFYRKMRANGRLVFQTPDEFEPTAVYQVDATVAGEATLPQSRDAE